jgi:GTPase SAR1 family protein
MGWSRIKLMFVGRECVGKTSLLKSFSRTLSVRTTTMNRVRECTRMRALCLTTTRAQGKEKQKQPKGKLLSTDGIDISDLEVPDKFKKGNADLKSLR